MRVVVCVWMCFWGVSVEYSLDLEWHMTPSDGDPLT